MRAKFTSDSDAANGAVLAATRGELKRVALFAFILTTAANVTVLCAPIYGMQVYDRVLSSRNVNTLVSLSVGLAVAMVLHAVLEYLRARLAMITGERMARHLTVPALLAATARNAGGRGGVAEQAMRDLNALRLFVAGPAAMVPMDMVWTPFLLATLFLMHWGFGVLGVVAAGLILVLNVLADTLSRGPLEEANAATVDAFAEFAVTVRQAEVVEAMGMVGAVSRRWHRNQARMLEALYQGSRVAKALMAAVRSFRLTVTGATVALGLVLCLNGEVSVGSMIAANMIVARLLLPFERVVTGFRQWIAALASYKRLTTALTEGAPRRETMPLPCPHGRLVVDRLTYIPPESDRPVLRGVTVTVEPGEVLGVIGPAGSGKSTLARLLVGLMPPTAGGAYLDGNSTFLWERDDFGRHVGFMPQGVCLLDGTVAENIARLREEDPRDILSAAHMAGVHEMISRLPGGYRTRVGDGGHALSGGQRQRVALARALYGQPKLLVLDEPNASLDPEGEEALLAAIDSARRASTAVVVIAQRPSIMAVADTLLVLKEGAVDALGSRDAVLRALSRPGAPVASLATP